MYERLLGLLRRLGEEAPVVLAIEDLHWADRSTRDLLRYLARNLRSERLAILATYRADDLHRGHPLRPLVAELERAGWAERLHLRPFTRAEVAEQIAEILGEPPAPAFVAEVFERAEGNAFCVEQLVATAREGGGRRLPMPARGHPARALRAPVSPAQRLLGVVAAGGPRVREELIAAVCGLVDAERDESLRAAVDHRILAVEGDAYVFRHALLREAAYAELLPGERHRLHAAYGAALAARPELGADDAVRGRRAGAALARRRCARPALAASVAAAVTAERAARLRRGERALHASARGVAALEDPADAAGVGLVTLLRRAAEAANLRRRERARRRADPGGARGDRRRGHAGDRRRAARAPRPLPVGGRRQRGGDRRLRGGRTARPRAPASRARARVLAAWGQALMLLSRYDESRATCEEAIGIARSVAARREEGHALNTLGVDLACLGDPTRRSATWRRRARSPRRSATSTIWPAPTSIWPRSSRSPLDRMEEAVEIARDGIALCEEVGLDCDYGVSLRAIAAGALFELGPLGRGRDAGRPRPPSAARSSARRSTSISAGRRCRSARGARRREPAPRRGRAS